MHNLHEDRVGGWVALIQHLMKGTSSTLPCTRPHVFLLAFLETNPCPTLYPMLPQPYTLHLFFWGRQPGYYGVLTSLLSFSQSCQPMAVFRTCFGTYSTKLRKSQPCCPPCPPLPRNVVPPFPNLGAKRARREQERVQKKKARVGEFSQPRC